MSQPTQVFRLGRSSTILTRNSRSSRRNIFLISQHRQLHQSILHRQQTSLIRRHRERNVSLASSLSSRDFHATSSAWILVNKDFEESQPTEEEANETEDTIPVWQNPLHHKNPDMQKMFAEDFEEGEEMPILPMPPLSTDDPDKVVAPPHIHDLAHEIVHLNLLEVKELTDMISDHFGFDDEMMAASYGGGMAGNAGAGATSGAEEEVKEEKTSFDLKLLGFDAKAKIKVIKEVRAVAGLGLKEAKELVESAPKIIQKDLKKDKAEELKATLEALGAQVEIV